MCFASATNFVLQVIEFRAQPPLFPEDRLPEIPEVLIQIPYRGRKARIISCLITVAPESQETLRPRYVWFEGVNRVAAQSLEIHASSHVGPREKADVFVGVDRQRLSQRVEHSAREVLILARKNLRNLEHAFLKARDGPWVGSKPDQCGLDGRGGVRQPQFAQA